MPRLQILQHKSYHPYLEKNKQRVREDEAKAAAEEAATEQRRVDYEAEARLDVLRRRAGSPSLAEDDNLPSTSSSKPGLTLMERHKKAKAKAEKEERKKKDRLDFDFPSETARREKARAERKENGGAESSNRGGRGEADSYDFDEDGREAVAWKGAGGHVNFFSEFEKSEGGPSLAEIAKQKQKKEKEDPYTMYLARPDKETKPWYTDKDLRRIEDRETGDEAEERRARDRRKDQRSKNRNDPLTHITSMLSSHPSNSHKPNGRHIHEQKSSTTPQAARLNRETSERQRALALIAKSKASAGWADTPSSVGGGDRSWAEDWERRKDRAGRRFFDGPAVEDRERDGRYERRDGRGWDRSRVGGRSWEV